MMKIAPALNDATEVAPRRRARASGLLVAAAVLAVVPSMTQAATEYTFGQNAYGQIGNGTTTGGVAGVYPTSPVKVSTLDNNVTATGQGGTVSLAVDNGALYGWGLTNYAATGDGVVGTGAGPAYSQETTPSASPYLTSGVTAVTSGSIDSVALAHGGVYTFGPNSNGDLGNGSASASNTVPTVIASLSSGVTAIASGTQTNYAVQNGAAYSWGYGSVGLLGNGTNSNANAPVPVTGLGSNVTAIGAGHYHALAVMNGAAYAWGLNEYGALGNPLLTTGYVPGAIYNTPQAIPTLTTGVTQVAGGQYHSLALDGGTVYAFGENNYGQLGNGTTVDSSLPLPVVIPDASPIVEIAASQYSSYALAADGTLWVWGENQDGQLGLGNTTNFSTPQELFAPTGYLFTGVSSGADALTVSVLEAPVPEPASLALITLAAVPLLRRSRRA